MEHKLLEKSANESFRYIFKYNKPKYRGNEKTEEYQIEVDIIFINDIFDRVDYNLECPYKREEWKVLAQINKLIENIEETKK